MKDFIRSGTVAFSVVASLMIAPAALAIESGAGKYIGEPGDSNSFDRVITIAPNAKWVNVTRGETIKFVDASSGQSFVWRFDTPNWTMVDLGAVAPDSLGGRHVSAYVANSPDDNTD